MLLKPRAPGTEAVVTALVAIPRTARNAAAPRISARAAGRRASRRRPCTCRGARFRRLPFVETNGNGRFFERERSRVPRVREPEGPKSACGGRPGRKSSRRSRSGVSRRSEPDRATRCGHTEDAQKTVSISSRRRSCRERARVVGFRRKFWIITPSTVFDEKGSIVLPSLHYVSLRAQHRSRRDEGRVRPHALLPHALQLRGRGGEPRGFFVRPSPPPPKPPRFAPRRFRATLSVALRTAAARTPRR